MRCERAVVVGIVLVAGLAWAKPAKKAAPKAGVASTETARTVEFHPWVQGVGGVSVPLSGGYLGAKFGVKAGLFDLGGLFNFNGLHVIASLLVTQASPTTGFELAPGVEYRRPVGPEGLEVYADLLPGFSHRRTITQVQFTGNTLNTDNAFVGRVALGVSYEIVSRIRIYLEPANFGLYVGSATSTEYAGLLGLSVSL